ncbi:MAG: formate/nitrite transporter family protein, partial [Pseudolabrys sp.]
MSARASIAVGRNQKAKPSSRRGRRGGITEQEVKDVEELATPRTPVIYEVVRRLGEEEMARPATSLWWSGVAAGLSISFSLLAQAILRTHLPDAPWEPLVTSFGYCIGFIMAVLSRQQLFTESTITAVLPVAAEFTWGNVGRMMRLWGIVLVANLAGTLFAALFCSFTPAVPTQVHDEMLAISRDLLAFGWWDMVFRAIASGFLMAAMVWLLPGAERTQLHVIALVTWLIAVGGFTHIVAGSMEAYLLVLAGDWAWWQMLSQFLLPVLIGNMIGG